MLFSSVILLPRAICGENKDKISFSFFWITNQKDFHIGPDFKKMSITKHSSINKKVRFNFVRYNYLSVPAQ